MIRGAIAQGRGILAIWVLTGLIVGGSMFYFWRVHRTRSAVAWLGSLQANIFWDHESRPPHPNPLRNLPRTVQQSMASVLGPEYLSVITTAEIDNPDANDSQLRRLSSLERLEILRLKSQQCSDATIEQVSQLGCLRELSITAEQVTFTGLLELRKLTQLKSLKLAAMSLTQGELAVLAAALPCADLSYNERIREKRYVRKVSERYPKIVRNNNASELCFESLFKHEGQGRVTLRPMAYHDAAIDHDEVASVDGEVLNNS